MLQKNPEKRIRAKDALSNIWLSQEEAKDNDIVDNSTKNMAQFGVCFFLDSLKTV